MVLHALHENNVPFINGGRPVDVVEIGAGLSQIVILGALVVAVVASLLSAKGPAQNTVAAARRHAGECLDAESDPAPRETIFQCLLAEEEQMRALPERFASGSARRRS